MTLRELRSEVAYQLNVTRRHAMQTGFLKIGCEWYTAGLVDGLIIGYNNATPHHLWVNPQRVTDQAHNVLEALKSRYRS